MKHLGLTESRRNAESDNKLIKNHGNNNQQHLMYTMKKLARLVRLQLYTYDTFIPGLQTCKMHSNYNYISFNTQKIIT